MLMYWTDNIWICYSAYVIFIILYNVVITITQFQLAIGLTTESFALVFGVNTFAAVLLNAVLTVILIDKAVLGLDVRTQFIVYSVYFGIVACVFLIHSAYNLYQKFCQQKQTSDSTSATGDKDKQENVEPLMEATM
uniref:Thiamine transporter 1-like n=1 Tax=Phallusia mammillata TaxID=59560 RepID=A0A6F9DRP6_9ASCI|nr:thiamine transporter 1-like [Phallusia mammillata]